MTVMSSLPGSPPARPSFNILDSQKLVQLAKRVRKHLTYL